jgi:hypothetical protein
LDAKSRGTPGSFVAAATAGGIIAQQVAGKAVRDALFLSTFHVRSLPLVMAAAASLSLVAVLRVSGLMSRYAPRRVLLVLFGLSGSALAFEWLLIPVSPSGPRPPRNRACAGSLVPGGSAASYPELACETTSTATVS